MLRTFAELLMADFKATFILAGDMFYVQRKRKVSQFMAFPKAAGFCLSRPVVSGKRRRLPPA